MPPPRVQREDTAARVVGAVVTIVEYLPRALSMFSSGLMWLFDFVKSTIVNIGRRSAEVVGFMSMCFCATMLFVIYYDPQTKIACMMKPALCPVNGTDMSSGL